MPSISRVRYEFKNDCEYIRIIDVFPENHRYLHFEDSIQGVLDLSAHHQPVLEYIGLMSEAARYFSVLPKAVLLGGLGSCGLLHALDHWWHRQAQIFTIENSERIYELARRFFRLRSRNQVQLGDLRSCLADADTGAYDLVIVDCYTALSIPPHLTTCEFMETVYDKLSDDGACIFNLWSPESNELCGDQIRTILEVFDRVGVIQSCQDQNLVVCARKNVNGDWPGHVTFKEKRFDVRRIGLKDRNYWPEYLKDSDVIRDNNLDQFFDAICMPL